MKPMFCGCLKLLYIFTGLSLPTESKGVRMNYTPWDAPVTCANQ